MIAIHPNPCKHTAKDAIHGRNFRVMNPAIYRATGKIIGARCTVCSPPKENGKKRGGVFALDQLQFKTA